MTTPASPVRTYAGWARGLVMIVASLALWGCGAIALFLPDQVDEYYPEAAWGSRTTAGGCPSHTPALEMHANNPDWLRVKVGIWNSKQTEMRKLKEPTLFITIYKGLHFLISEQDRRNKTPVSIRASHSFIDLSLADGSQRRLEVPEFSEQFSIVGLGFDPSQNYRDPKGMGKTIELPLGVAPQSMTLTFPDLTVNSEAMSLGTVKFIYRKNTTYPC
jgi:hypothetical protein